MERLLAFANEPIGRALFPFQFVNLPTELRSAAFVKLFARYRKVDEFPRDRNLVNLRIKYGLLEYLMSFQRLLQSAK